MGPPPAAVLFMGGGTCGPRGRQRRRWESWTNRRADYRCGKTGTRSARLATGVKCSDAPPHTTTSCSQASRIALSRSNGEDEDGWTASALLSTTPFWSSSSRRTILVAERVHRSDLSHPPFQQICCPRVSPAQTKIGLRPSIALSRLPSEWVSFVVLTMRSSSVHQRFIV